MMAKLTAWMVGGIHRKVVEEILMSNENKRLFRKIYMNNVGSIWCSKFSVSKYFLIEFFWNNITNR